MLKERLAVNAVPIEVRELHVQTNCELQHCTCDTCVECLDKRTKRVHVCHVADSEPTNWNDKTVMCNLRAACCLRQ
jgi:hypothetical protein